jgi:hypothetical protein
MSPPPRQRRALKAAGGLAVIAVLTVALLVVAQLTDPHRGAGAGGLPMGPTGGAPASVPALDCPATNQIGRAELAIQVLTSQRPEVYARTWLAESTRLRQRYPGLRGVRVAAETATDVYVVVHQRRGAVRAILWFERVPEPGPTTWSLRRDVAC